MKICLESCGEIKINVYYNESKYENPLKIKFPNLSCCDDYDMAEEIEDEITNLENDQFSDAYELIKQMLREIISVKYINKRKNYDLKNFDEEIKNKRSSRPTPYCDPERDPMADYFDSIDEDRYDDSE